MDRWATFDCYGTLIDWNGGIRGEFARLWPDADADALLARYHAHEPRVEAESPHMSYRDVLALALKRVAHDEGLVLPAEERGALADSLPGWRAFAETTSSLAEARARGWKLAILSNTDREFIEASKRTIGVPFELEIVAHEIGSYKPAHGHWQRFFTETGADRAAHVHVGASLFHDVEPANELDLRSIWINRLGEQRTVDPTRELPDLTRLAETLDELVPA